MFRNCFGPFDELLVNASGRAKGDTPTGQSFTLIHILDNGLR